MCTIVAHNTAQNSPDNFPSYPPVPDMSSQTPRTLLTLVTWQTQTTVHTGGTKLQHTVSVRILQYHSQYITVYRQPKYGL